MLSPNLPSIGQIAPPFEANTQKGLISFPDYSQGNWCILFAHPANFTSAWVMYSTLISMKERFFTQRNTKLLAVGNENLYKNGFSDKVRRYIGIVLKAPVIDDSNYQISNLYGMASRRHREQDHGRLAFILDPEGIIRAIIENPQPSIETAIRNIELGFDQLQGVEHAKKEPPKFDLNPVEERPDTNKLILPTVPAYFNKDNLLKN